MCTYQVLEAIKVFALYTICSICEVSILIVGTVFEVHFVV